MKKKCKYCDAEITISIFDLFFDVYCEKHIELIKWRSNEFPETAKYYDLGADELHIVNKSDSHPSFRYNKDIDEKLKLFTDEKAICLLESTKIGDKPMLVELLKYDKDSGFIYYRKYNESILESLRIFIFDIYSVIRLHEKKWLDNVKAYKVVLVEEDGSLHSEGNDKGTKFIEGKKYNAIKTNENCRSFYNNPYYDTQGDQEDNIPFRLCIDLEDVFFYYPQIITDPTQPRFKIYEILASKVAPLSYQSNNWAARDFSFVKEVTKKEIIDYFSDKGMLAVLFSYLKEHGCKRPDIIWERYCSLCNN